MDTLERIRELAAAGLPASLIAQELGISRQRVYQLAKKGDVALPRYHVTVRRAPARPPKPRVITGGVETTISHAAAGTVAELLVAADLLARGWLPYMPTIRSRGHDVIATRGAELITVEVRSAHRNAAGKLIFSRKPEEKSSHYALVVTGEPVHYIPALE